MGKYGNMAKYKKPWKVQGNMGNCGNLFVELLFDNYYCIGYLLYCRLINTVGYLSGCPFGEPFRGDLWHFPTILRNPFPGASVKLAGNTNTGYSILISKSNYRKNHKSYRNL